MENLDGNRSVVFQVCRQEDRRHPPAADRAVYRVAVREAGLQTSEEGGQAALPTPQLKDSGASATPGTLPRSPDGQTRPCDRRCAWPPGKAPPCPRGSSSRSPPRASPAPGGGTAHASARAPAEPLRG